MLALRDPAAPLWEWRGPKIYLAGLALLSAVACLLPLSDHLGYELSELVALYAGLFGGAPGVAAARRELLRAREGREASAATAVGTAIGFALAALAVPVLIVLLNGLRRPACDPLGGLVLYGAIAVPSALLAASLGAACGFLAGRFAGVVYAAVFVLTLVVSLWPVAAGPQVFAFHHLGGMFPGPIYDEAIRASPGLWWFRAATMLWFFALCGAALASGPSVSARGERRRGGGALAILAVFALAAGWMTLQAERLHWKASVSQIDRELGGRIETASLVLHFPREKKDDERRLLAEQADAAVLAVREFLGLPDGGPRIDVFLYRSADEKRRLLGAAETSFAKPWLRQVHTNDEPAPHRILRHELAHAVAARAARGPFKVPGRLGGLVPDMTLIEGLAVAADWPGGEFSVHEEAAALRALGLAPEVPRLFKPGLFYGESGARAYTMAGSFVRWLWFTRGPQPLLRAYGGEPLESVYGPLPQLAAEHAKYLDARGTSQRAQALLQQRFRAPGIVRRRCPHEVAGLAKEAQAALVRSDPARAAELWQRCAALEPDDPNLLLGLRRAQLAAKNANAAKEAEDRALGHPKLSSAQRAQLLTEAGDAAWKAGDGATARDRYRTASALPQFEVQERGLQARLAALDVADAQPAARRLFGENDAGPLTWLYLWRWSQAAPSDGLPLYLLAKQMQNRGEWQECAKMAADALARRLPGPLFVEEALRMRGLAAWHLGDKGTARAAFTQLRRGAGYGRAREVESWLSMLR